MDSHAWLGSQELKNEILTDLNEDLARERYIQGTYLAAADSDDQAFYGCHVGCLMMAWARYDNRRGPDPDPLTFLAGNYTEYSARWHGQVPEKLGMPRDVAEFWDKFYEKLPPTLAPQFAVTSLACVPVGADLRTVLHQLAAWLLVDEHAGFLAGAEPRTSDEQQLQSYLVVLGSYWAHRAQDYTRSPHIGVDPIQTDEMAEAIREIGRGLNRDTQPRFNWAFQALHSATSGTVTHHVVCALIDEWAEMMREGDAILPDVGPLSDPFAEYDMPADDWPLWTIATKFFQLCAAAPQGPAQ